MSKPPSPAVESSRVVCRVARLQLDRGLGAESTDNRPIRVVAREIEARRVFRERAGRRSGRPDRAPFFWLVARVDSRFSDRRLASGRVDGSSSESELRLRCTARQRRGKWKFENQSRHHLIAAEYRRGRAAHCHSRCESIIQGSQSHDLLCRMWMAAGSKAKTPRAKLACFR